MSFYKRFYMTHNLDERLLCAASFVREGKRFADIGSDHAYLPIHLALTGKIDDALASDINEGPVESAIQNINAFGVGDRVRAICSDGLVGAESFAPEDIAILGMGGELIEHIIDRAPWVKNEKIRLILQPMTHAETLYLYLCREGFSIVDERISSTSDKRTDRIYRVIVAEYSGQAYEPSVVEAFVGKKNIERYRKDGDVLVKKYIKHMIEVFGVRMNGKKYAGIDASFEEGIISSLEEIIKAEN